MSDTQAQSRKKSLADALQQNAEYFGFDVQDEIVLDTTKVGGHPEEVFTIVYREFLDVETRRRVNAVYAQYNSCDREMIKVPQGDNKPPLEVPGVFKEPRQLRGQPFDLDEELGKAVWGEDTYNRWVGAGGPPGLIQITWNRMRLQVSRRMSQDSKSS